MRPSLGIEPVEDTPRATDEANLKAMADMINALGQRGHTYTSDGSIYFKISTLPSYGKLARLDHEGIQSGARVDSDEYDKESARDFVLWKATKPGEPTWDVGCGPGRPGWHIECSAMALRLLGESPIDIHTGGVDLVFPHHENEIAQSEGATGKEFSRFWFHVEHLLVDNQKMSKSVGNFYTVQDVLDKGFRLSALRYILLSGYYRKQLNFTWTGLEQAEEALRRITDFLGRVEALAAGGTHPEVDARVKEAVDAFDAALRDDLNTAAGPRRDLRSDPRAQHRDGRARGGEGRRAGDHRRVRSLRSRARRAVAAPRRGCDAADPAGGDRRRHPGPPGRPAPPRLRRSRSHSPGSARQGRDPRRRPARDALEAEIDVRARSSDRPKI